MAKRKKKPAKKAHKIIKRKTHTLDGRPLKKKNDKRNVKTGQFGPGNCANPEGRAAGRIDLVRILNDIVSETDPTTMRSYAEGMMREYRDLAKSGRDPDRMHVLEGIMDRLCGKPKQAVEVTNTKGQYADLSDEALAALVKEAEAIPEVEAE